MFSSATATLSPKIQNAYSNTVWQIGNIAFYSMLFHTNESISGNEDVVTFPKLSLYRHDSTFSLVDGTPLCDAYLAQNTNILKANGGTLPENKDIKVFGFYQVK